jgi:hypothetical protein
VSWSSSDSSTEAIVVNYCGDGICMMMPVIPGIGELFRFSWNDPSFPQDTADLTMRTVFGCIRWTGDGEQGTLAGSELPAGMGYLFSGVDTQGLLAMIADE